MARPQKHVFVWVQSRPPAHPKGSCGAGRNSGALLQSFIGELDRRSLWGRIAITSAGCLGPCDLGPNVLVYPDGILYSGVTAEDIPALIDEHLLGDKPVERLLAPAEAW
jgi:(2Fe-2S) ferredoxin